jgi:hypothetical protein
VAVTLQLKLAAHWLVLLLLIIHTVPLRAVGIVLLRLLKTSMRRIRSFHRRTQASTLALGLVRAVGRQRLARARFPRAAAPSYQGAKARA